MTQRINRIDIVIVSDTHELHRELDVPPGDLLIHAGDWTILSKSTNSVKDFNMWLSEMPHRHKIIVPGNHEFYLEGNLRRRDMTHHATVLIDQAVTIDGLRVYGSPVTSMYGGAFGKSSASDRKLHWSKIPDDTHVLITHGPPHGILDRSPGQEHIGDPELLARVRELEELRLHVFGHVHGAYGMVERYGITFVNASNIGHEGGIVNKPVVLRIMPVDR